MFNLDLFAQINDQFLHVGSNESLRKPADIDSRVLKHTNQHIYEITDRRPKLSLQTF